MEDKNTIAYKQWLESLQEPAPEGAWDSIADQLDIDQAWEGISESLDIDDVWNQVEQNLPQTVPAAPNHLPKLFWAAAIVALFTLTTPVTDQLIHQPVQKNKRSNTVTTNKSLHDSQKAEVIETAKDHAAPVVTGEQSQNLSKEKKSKLVVSSQAGEGHKITSHKSENSSTDYSVSEPSGIPTISVPEEKFSEKQLPVVPVQIPEENIVLPARENEHAVTELMQQVQPDSIQKEIKTDSTKRLAVQEESTDSAQQEKPLRTSRWQVGLIGAVKNTWLINPETSNGLKRSSLTNTKVTWGKEVGVLVQRSIGRKSFIQAEYYFYSEIGQRYQQYIDALYQTKDITLNYQKLQLVYRTRVFQTRKLPPVYVAAGFHASRLDVASTSIGGEGQVVTEQYMPWDYGVLAGLESEFFLTEKIIVVPGIRASYGMRNIYGGNTQSPANLNKTNTATLGFSLALKYSLH